MSKVVKIPNKQTASIQPNKRVRGVPHRVDREVPVLSQEELQLFGGLTAQVGFTLVNAEKIYKKP